MKSERVDTLGEHIECHTVGVGGSLGYYLLAHEPIIVGAGAAQIGELAGERVGGGKIFDVFQAIHGLDIKAFVGAPHKFLVKGSTLEVSFYLGLPLGGGDGRKLVK